MNTFKNNLKSIELKLNLRENQIYEKLEEFQRTFPFIKNMCSFMENYKDKTICEFDLVLQCYLELYQNINLDNYFAEQIFPNDNFADKKFICLLIIFRTCIHDLICLRTLYLQRFESQFNSIFRTFFEKFKLFILCIYDSNFFSEYINNDSNFSKIERYNKLFAPRCINKRIKQNLQRIENDIQNSQVITWGQATERNAYEIFKDISNKIYSLNSLFIHFNDGMELLRYFSNGNSFNMSITNGSSVYFKGRFNYALEAALLYYFDFEHFWINICKNQEELHQSGSILLEYYNYIIEEKYTPNKDVQFN